MQLQDKQDSKSKPGVLDLMVCTTTGGQRQHRGKSETQSGTMYSSAESQGTWRWRLWRKMNRHIPKGGSRALEPAGCLSICPDPDCSRAIFEPQPLPLGTECYDCITWMKASVSMFLCSREALSTVPWSDDSLFSHSPPG